LTKHPQVLNNNGGSAVFEWFFPEEDKDPRAAWADAIVRTTPGGGLKTIEQDVQIVFGNFFGTAGFIQQNKQKKPSDVLQHGQPILEWEPLLLSWNHYNEVCAKRGAKSIPWLVPKRASAPFFLGPPFDQDLDSFESWRLRSVEKMVDKIMEIIKEKENGTSGGDVALLVSIDSSVPAINLLQHVCTPVHKRLKEKKFEAYSSVWLLHNQAEAVSCWPGLSDVGQCDLRFPILPPEINSFQHLSSAEFQQLVMQQK
jgi:hypothetical protein